ncbi:hypothetical protein [uncultured Desulfuromonas sp.]|uniref:hypothetical protein n=1 Tax=uncultured Desulfuromonas sp. TaxID=181013 RepID=UPI002AAA65FA|nr:hypothetical protein [uncultured Desulfuromonas sp.]
MIKQVFTSSFISIGVGFIFEIVNKIIGATYIYKFFEDSLVTILVALLAVNAATMGIVLTKIRDLVSESGGSRYFIETRKNMLLSVKEQIGLIISSTVILSIKSSNIVLSVEYLDLFLNTIVGGVFVYALLILYDTAKGVLIIIDFDTDD